jgi:hypothetical protein
VLFKDNRVEWVARGDSDSRVYSSGTKTYYLPDKR